MHSSIQLSVSIVFILYCFWKWLARTIWLQHATKASPGRSSRCPPVLSYVFPILRSTIPFLFHGLHLFDRIRREFKYHSIVGISLIHDQVYVVKDVQLSAWVLKSSAMTVTHAYALALRNCFGMSKKASDAYARDQSGSLPVPLGINELDAKDRLEYMTQINLHKLFLGPGLPKLVDRFEEALADRLYDVAVPPQGLVVNDLYEFFEEHAGSALIDAVFGLQLLQQNPDFARDLWTFDRLVMQLARCTPALLAPEAYRVRSRLIENVKSWHSMAEASFQDDKVNMSTDLEWGSYLLRRRRETLLKCRDQTRDSVASTDLALMWATVTNVIPSSATLLLEISRNIEATNIVLHSTSNAKINGESLVPAVKVLQKNDLILSMYAETLRLGSLIHIPRTHPHQALNIDNMTIPKDKLIFVSAFLAHNDEQAWNTAAGTRPLDKFWSQRFLIETSEAIERNSERVVDHGEVASKGPKFSLKGLESFWIPYGGGHHACPGRVLAKHIMLTCTAALVHMFEIDVKMTVKDIDYGHDRFGFGVRRPKSKIPVLLKRRQQR